MIRFTKMQGIGNDFVMIDALQETELPGDLSGLSRKLCDRHLGIGADGLIFIEKGGKAPFRMRMLNPDGSESEMCGNGIRCFAILLRDHGHSDSDSAEVETGAGVLHTTLLPGNRVRVDMGTARLTRGEVGMHGDPEAQFVDQPIGVGQKGTAVSMGNPHLVVFVPDVAKVDLEIEGPKLESHELFPKRTNVHFAQVVDRNTILQRTWERGAGATLACGTGACSAAVAGVLAGATDRKVEVRLPGGNLELEYDENGHVFMTGPAETVFTGEA